VHNIKYYSAQERLVEGSVENIRHGLEWAGLNYDYGLGHKSC
jgi:hypothetical protein